MSDQSQFDYEALAGLLDQVIPAGQAGIGVISESDPLIDAAARLASAPRPGLSPEARTRIYTTVLEAQRSGFEPPFGELGYARLRLLLAAAVIVILTLAFIIGVGLLNQPQVQEEALTPPPTRVMSDTPIPSLTYTSVPRTQPPVIVPIVAPTVNSTWRSAPTLTPAVVIVEGPVQTIDGNRITIYGIVIEVDPSDPRLEAIQINDYVRIEGRWRSAINPVLIPTLIVIVDDQITPTIQTSFTPARQVSSTSVPEQVTPVGDQWRDDGTCANPPPTWAPAIGWRRRCQGTSNAGQPELNPGQGQGNGNGNGNGNN